MPEPQTGMPKGAMRRLINLAKKDAVNCAVGLGPEAGFGLLMMDRSKQPRAVEKMLTEAVPGAKNTRYGTAVVDLANNPKLVKLTLNRSCSGMARRLAKTLKGTGISKVLIVLPNGNKVERN